MQNKDTFSSYHPMVNFVFFALVLGCTMFFMHPISLCISLLNAFGYGIYLKGWKMVRFSLLYLLPMMVMAAVLNPAFNHEGVTIIEYLPNIGLPLSPVPTDVNITATMVITAITAITIDTIFNTNPTLLFFSGPFIASFFAIVVIS
jgi:energy-coupling factor transport system permease protein